MFTRRSLLGSFAGSVVARAASVKPNFLFILADDHAAYVQGADGNSMAHTPHLDEFGSQGMRFAAHYCNSPVCTPSRQSFFTGQLPHAAGVTRLPTPLADDRPTLATQFQKAGYSTAVFGKMHFNKPGAPGMHGFEIVETEDVITRDWERQPPRRQAPANRQYRKLPWRPFKDPAPVWLNADTLPYPRYEEDMRACYQVRQAEQFLEQTRSKPFALWVSLMEPHSPFDFPEESRGRFAAASFKAPVAGPEDAWQIPLIFRDLTARDKQGITASYYTSVEFLDRNIGRILGKLKDLGLENDTYVVYMADHGYDLGQHGRIEKHCGYDPALRVPLIMRFPGRIQKGEVRDLTEHVDVTATIVDVMNLDPLPVMHGRSLRPYLEGAHIQPRDHIFSEYLENEEAYIRTERWKFIYCTGKRARTDGYATDHPTPGHYRILFDLKADPGEFHNVVKENPSVASTLQGLMLQRFRKTHPEAVHEPRGVSEEEVLDWYLRPRDL
jgi:choline-sulfatase